ncbi:MAG: ribonuclease P protein component [Phenylobacterium sp.]|jgi:ribonuclease P protein component
MTELTFLRESRLLTPSDFNPVFKNPVVASSSAFTFLAKPNDLGKPRLGLTIAKKRVKHAHARNRIKRLTRESFRLGQHDLPAIDVIVMAKNGTDKLSNEELTVQLQKLWQKLTRRCKGC